MVTFKQRMSVLTILSLPTPQKFDGELLPAFCRQIKAGIIWAHCCEANWTRQKVLKDLSYQLPCAQVKTSNIMKAQHALLPHTHTLLPAGNISWHLAKLIAQSLHFASGLLPKIAVELGQAAHAEQPPTSQSLAREVCLHPGPLNRPWLRTSLWFERHCSPYNEAEEATARTFPAQVWNGMLVRLRGLEAEIGSACPRRMKHGQY